MTRPMTAEETLREIAEKLHMSSPANADVALAVSLIVDEHQEHARALAAVCDILGDKEPEKPLPTGDAVTAALRAMEHMRNLEWDARENAVALSKAEHGRSVLQSQFDITAESYHQTSKTRRVELAEIAETMGSIPPPCFEYADKLARAVVARAQALRLHEERTPVDPKAGRRALDEDAVAWLVFLALDSLAATQEQVAARFGVDSAVVRRVTQRGRDVYRMVCNALQDGMGDKP